MRVIWNEAGGLKECPYFYRWVLDFGLFSIRLHKWVANDDLRAFHDHPFWFLTIVLWGGYFDTHEIPCPCPGPVTFEHRHARCDTLHAGSVRFRHAGHRHNVEIYRTPTWTLLLAGPANRRWGFYDRVTGKAMKRDKYFAERGHHPCDPASPPVRMRPDGSRI